MVLIRLLLMLYSLMVAHKAACQTLSNAFLKSRHILTDGRNQSEGLVIAGMATAIWVNDAGRLVRDKESLSLMTKVRKRGGWSTLKSY